MIMEPDGWYIDGCTKASPEDWSLYNEWTSHLPKREELTPYHSGPHSIKHFEHALAIAGLTDKRFNVFEVGFCLGHSAEIFFRLGAESVTSIEISDRAQTMQAKAIMEAKWPGFTFLRPGDLLPRTDYDFAFIDGDHSESAITKDINTSLSLGINVILADDWFPLWGDTQKSMQKLGMTPCAILGTMALWVK